MATLRPWICLVFIAVLTINVHATSLAHTVFLPSDRSLNPFSDFFIQKVINMDRKRLYAITQMDGSESFFLQLMHNDSILSGPSTRHSVDDPYESIFDDKLDDQLMLQDNIDGEWVQLMTAGPLAVNYVGNLLVLASKRNFPLTRPPNFVFKHIENPDSFRMTIAQLSGSMYSALIGAHTAMDRIQLNVQKVPNHIKTALKLVIAGSPMLIEILLPNTLKTIGQIANESAAHARTTFDKFSALQELIIEIVGAFSNTHSTQSDVVGQIQSEINKAKREQEDFNNNVNSVKAQYENARHEMEKARKEYQDAYNAIPTLHGWFSRLFRKIVRDVVKIVTFPARILGCILGLCSSNRAAAEAAAAETAKQNAIAKANQHLEVLRAAEQRHADFARQQAAQQENLIRVINKIAALDLNRMSEQEIVDILIGSVKEMNQIKEQWGRLIQFFSKLSVQADSTQQIIVNEFIGIIKDGQALNLSITPSDREFFVEILSITSQEIERGAHLLYVMSKTYYDISSEYMINQIANMHALFLGTDAERSSYLHSLAANTTSTSIRIIRLAEERQDEYSSRNKERRKEYERFLANLASEEFKDIIG